jgi:hypothetical protein
MTTATIDAAFLSHGDFVLTQDGRVAMVLRKRVEANRAIVRYDGSTAEIDIDAATIARVTTNMDHVNAWRGGCSCGFTGTIAGELHSQFCPQA